MIRKRSIVADTADILIITGDPVALILSDDVQASPRDGAQGGQK